MMEDLSGLRRGLEGCKGGEGGAGGGKEVQGEGEGSVYLNQDSRSLQELHLLQDLLLEAVPGHRALYKQHEGVSKPTHTQR